MIEVERKYKPTQEQKDELIKGATLLGAVKNHDIYYDYSDFRLLKEDVRFRNRNGIYELKTPVLKGDKEIINVDEIKKYFGTNLDLQEFIKNNLIVLMEYTTEREKYKKGKFELDFDESDFGFNLCEIEVMVVNENEVSKARQEIKNFATEYKMEGVKKAAKAREYLKLRNPDAYKEVYLDRELENLKIK